jgi:creatinine amidohydrolase
VTTSSKGYSIFRDTIADMTWPAVEAAALAGEPLLIPIGVIEQHGLQLPLATDVYGAHVWSSLVKAELAKNGLPCQIAPPFYFGMTTSTAMFPGSVNVKPESMVAILTDILESYASWGFRRQFIINHHGDAHHLGAIVRVIELLRDQNISATYVLCGLRRDALDRGYQTTFAKPFPLTEAEVLNVLDSETTAAARERLTRSPHLDVHAGEGETSLIMRWAPDTLPTDVDHTLIEPAPESPRQFAEATPQGRWREISPLGHIGDPARASVENGDLYLFEAADIARAIAETLPFGPHRPACC